MFRQRLRCCDEAFFDLCTASISRSKSLRATFDMLNFMPCLSDARGMWSEFFFGPLRWEDEIVSVCMNIKEGSQSESKEEEQKCFLVLVLLVLPHGETTKDVEVAAGVLFDSLV